MKSCLFVLNKSLDLHILIWYRKMINIVSMQRNWYRVHDWHNPSLLSAFEEISLTTGFSVWANFYPPWNPWTLVAFFVCWQRNHLWYIAIKWHCFLSGSCTAWGTAFPLSPQFSPAGVLSVLLFTHNFTTVIKGGVT